MLPVRMTESEKRLFASSLRSARSYVEFGSGGSTVFASSIMPGVITSLDSSREWLDRVARVCASNPDRPQPRLVLADIGPVVDWGYPLDESCRDRWPSYATKIWDIPGTDNADLYLIDGRFRVSCFLETLMHCRATAVLLIHDFAERPAYHIVREFAREIAASSSLSAFIRREDFNRDLAYRLLEAKRYDRR